MTFINWISRVKILLFTNYQVVMDDIPDYDYYLNFECGLTPDDMVELIADNGFM